MKILGRNMEKVLFRAQSKHEKYYFGRVLTTFRPEI